jgi:hypothetical protein
LSAIPPIGSSAIPALGGVAATARPSTAAASKSASPLWDVLTDEERAYFAAVQALGPVSYGANGAPPASPAAPVGQRIDVQG